MNGPSNVQINIFSGSYIFKKHILATPGQFEQLTGGEEYEDDVDDLCVCVCKHMCMWNLDKIAKTETTSFLTH